MAKALSANISGFRKRFPFASSIEKIVKRADLEWPLRFATVRMPGTFPGEESFVLCVLDDLQTTGFAQLLNRYRPFLYSGNQHAYQQEAEVLDLGDGGYALRFQAVWLKDGVGYQASENWVLAVWFSLALEKTNDFVNSIHTVPVSVKDV